MSREKSLPRIARLIRGVADDCTRSGMRGYARRLRGLATTLEGGKPVKRKRALACASRAAIDMGMDEIDPSFAQLLRSNL